MWQIIKNEWSFLRRSRTLLGLSLGFAGILILSIYLGHLQTNAQTKVCQEAQAHLRAQWEDIECMNPHGAAHYGTYVFKPVGLLGSLDEGVRSVTGNVLRVEAHVQHEIVHSEASQMQTASAFGKLNGSLLLQYILPLLLIFLAYQAISGEKQSGRLKLLILQGASANSLIWGKTLAVWFYGMALLSVTVGAYVLLHFQSLNADLLCRTLLFFAAYVIYYFIVCGLTVVLSARWKQASLALTTMLGIWIVWTIFLPNILMSAIEKWHELPSRNTFQTDMKDDRAEGLDGHNPRDVRRKALKEETLRKYEGDDLSELPINFTGVVMQADEEFGNQVWDKHFGNLRSVMQQQKRSYQTAGIFDPFIALQNVSRGFAGNDNLHHHHFLRQAENYRRVLIKTLNDKLAYGGSKTGERWEAGNEFYRSVPDFDYEPVSVATVLPEYARDFAVLLMWAGALSFLMIFTTRKLQVL
ncbi:MAG: ABC transporter permease [Gemmataceae bacterium]